MSLNNLLIHIGLHKTGTTWLQETLFSSDSRNFIPLSPDGDPKYLGKLFIWAHNRHNLLSPFEENEKEIRNELGEILDNIEIGEKIPVISHERLSGHPDSGRFDCKTIADRIKTNFPDAKILFVIREQKDMILSTYFQYLKMGGIDSLSKYISRRYDAKRPGFELSNYYYLDLVSYYFKLFSPKNVLVLPYEMFKEDLGLYLTHLGNFTKTDLSNWEQMGREIINKRSNDFILSRFPFLNLLFQKSSVNAFSPLYIRGGEKLIPLANWALGPFSKAHLSTLPKFLDSFVGDKFIKTNQELSKLIGIDLSRYGYF